MDKAANDFDDATGFAKCMKGGDAGLIKSSSAGRAGRISSRRISHPAPCAPVEAEYVICGENCLFRRHRPRTGDLAGHDEAARVNRGPSFAVPLIHVRTIHEFRRPHRRKAGRVPNQPKLEEEPQYFIRVVGARGSGLVCFEFGVIGSDLHVELVLPPRQFEEFCERHRIRNPVPPPAS